MDTEIAAIRNQAVEKILAAQDAAFRWGYDEQRSRERPEYLYYSPNYRSTLWTLVALADIQAPAGLPQVLPSIRLVDGQFYDPEHGMFRLPGMGYFPIPCLNGNMLYLQQYFGAFDPGALERTVAFFEAHQRFDDGGFRTPQEYPYFSNHSCYGAHTCYWGVVKLFKGLSFIPREKRSAGAQRLLEKCIDFVLLHEVCFSSHHRDTLIHHDIGRLTFPNFYKSDFLEILWLLAREGVRDARTRRALDLLGSKMKEGRIWRLEKPVNIITSIGQKDSPNAFVTARALEVLEFFGG